MKLKHYLRTITALAGLLMLSFSAYAQQPAFLTNGLVAYYPFDGDTYNYSDSAIIETGKNISYSTNRFGTKAASASFNGASSSVVFDDKSSSQFNTLPLTVSVWVNIGTDYGADIPIISKYYQASANGWALDINSTIIKTWYYGSQGTVNSIDAQGLRTKPQGIGKWKHIVCVYDELGGTLYLNGIVVTNSNWSRSPSPPTSTMPVTIGMGIYSDNTGPRFFKGLVDDIRIYNRALSAGEVAALYEYEGPVNDPPTLRAIGNLNITEMQSWSLKAVGEDIDLPPQTISYSLPSAPDGMVIDSGSGVMRWTPTEAQGPGSYPVIVRVTDPLGLWVEQRFTVTVTEVNTPPVLSGISDQYFVYGQALNLQLAASDSDLPQNLLSYKLVSSPTNAVLSPTGLLSWSPTRSQSPSSNIFAVSLSDGLATVTNRFSVEVLDLITTLDGKETTN